MSCRLRPGRASNSICRPPIRWGRISFLLEAGKAALLRGRRQPLTRCGFSCIVLATRACWLVSSMGPAPDPAHSALALAARRLIPALHYGLSDKFAI